MQKKTGMARFLRPDGTFPVLAGADDGSTEVKDEKLRDILAKISDFESKAASIGEKLATAADQGEIDTLKTDLKSAKDQIDTLLSEKASREQEIEKAELVLEVKSLRERIDAHRDVPGSLFGGTVGGTSPAARKRETSFFADVKAASKGDYKAFDRLQAIREEWDDLDVKGMTEGTDSAGGYLVNPEISDELIRLRLQGSVIRGLCSSVNIQSDSLQIASVTGGLSAGWVAELAAKPETDMTFGSLTVNVFTAAGLGAASNQLLADSRPSIDSLITQDLAYRLMVLEETAFINGSGTGQPRGILQTAGINSVVYTDASPTAEEMLDQIQAAIYQVQLNYFGEPNAIVMHPRTWQFISKARATASGLYVIGTGANANGRVASDPQPRPSLFGLPVYTTTLVPTTLGGGTESAIIVGDFSQALILDRQGITVDTSEHVRFTTNQTVFRVEERVGFTAARYPKAFAAVTGTGMAGN